jgi:hypothetical protein
MPFSKENQMVIDYFQIIISMPENPPALIRQDAVLDIKKID